MPCKCYGTVPRDIKVNCGAIRTHSKAGHPTTTYLKIFDINHTGIERQFYWNKCTCNEYDALLGRHLLGHIEKFDAANPYLKMLEKSLEEKAELFYDKYGFTTQSNFAKVIANTRPGLRARYRRAYTNIYQNKIEYSKMLARVQTFVKYEKIPEDKYFDGKPPRLIQHRSYEYLYLLKSFILDHDLKLKEGLLKWGDQSVDTIFTKMHDQFGIAQVLWDNWNSFDCPMAICLDHSKFDGHYCEELLNIEHKYWKRLNRSRLLALLLNDQLNNKAVTSMGMRYKFRGGRASGEYTTSTGNSIMNYCMLECWLRASGITKFRISVNGDDSVVMIELSDRSKLLGLDFFNNFNMETTCDREVTLFQEITYCQTSPIRVERNGSLQWYMVKTPLRVMSRIQYMSSQHKRIVNRVLSAEALCELTINQGVPLLQALAIRLLKESDLTRPLGSVDKIPAKSSGNSEAVIKPINSITRADFQIAFRITVQEQLQYENDLAGDLMTPSSNTSIYNYLNKYKYFTQY